MKKNAFYLVALIGAIAILISCNQQEESSQKSQDLVVNEKQEMAQLMVALDNYNADYRETHGTTRSLGGWFRRFLRVVYVDAVGAICGSSLGPWGAIAGGASASAVAYCLDDGQIHPIPHAPRQGIHEGGGFIDPILVDDYIYSNALVDVVLVSNIPQCTDSAGYYHNKAIMYLYNNNLLHITNNNTDSLTNAICEQAEEISSNGRGTTTNAELLQQIKFSQLKSAYPTMILSQSFDDFVYAYINLYPEYEDELIILKNYISVLCDIDPEENDGSYAEGVLEIINDSQLSNGEKKRLGEAIITGNASARLWNID